MKIIRHRLTKDERQGLDHLVQRAHGVEADHTITPTLSLEKIYYSERRSTSEVAHWLRLQDFRDDISLILPLMISLSQVTDSRRDLQEMIILEGVSVQRENAALMLIIGSLFGEIREFVGHGAPIVEISDKGKIVKQRPSSDNALEFKLHTDLSFHEDPPEFVAFLMVKQGAKGGESIFCDPGPIIDRLPPNVIETLQEPFKFPASLHRPDMGPQYFPILKRTSPSGFEVRFRRDGLEPQSGQQARALAIFQREIDTQAIELLLAPGDLTVFSNRRLLHGRRHFQNKTDQGVSRCALRAYLGRHPASR